MLGFHRRFDPHFADLGQRVAAGEIGRLEQLAIISRDSEPSPKRFLETSGGIFRDLTIHDFDTARCFVPAITEVTARGANQFSAEIREIGDYDAASIIMTGTDGEQITITNSRHTAYGFDQRIEAFGSEGLLTVGNISDSCVRRWSGTAVEALQPYQHFFPERYSNAYRLELAEFVKAVRGEPHQCPDFEDGRAALLLADAAERSARTGRTVSVDLTA
jgi:myo-inositol 2-dehydrogenase/D-chiro-inositol 1-dehydrogenase